MNGGLAAARRKALQGADQEPEGHHQQYYREDGEDRCRRLVGRSHETREPRDRNRNQLNHVLERTLVVDAGPEHPPEEAGHQAGEAGQKAGRHFERQEDAHRDQVEQIVTGGHLEGAPQFLTVPQVPESGDRVGDRRTDVGAHDHRDGALERQGRIGRCHQTDDERTRDGGTLHQRGAEDSDEQAYEGIRRSPEKAVEKPGTETLEPLAEAVNRPQEEEEEKNQPDDPGDLTG